MGIQQFEIHPRAKQAIDAAAHELVTQITEHPNRPKQEPPFKSEKPSVTLTDKEIIDAPLFGYTNQFGQWVARYSYRNGRCIGLAGDGYQHLRELVDQFLKISWVRSSLGRDFLEENILRWSLNSFGRATPESLVDHLLFKAKEAVKNFTLWVPVAFLEVEREFTFGSVRIAPITKNLFAEREEIGVRNNPTQADSIRHLFSDLKKRFQGSAAIVATVEAEEGYAQERGLETAEAVIALLRIFSVAAFTPWVVCPIAIAGSEICPKTSAIIFGQSESFSFSDALVKPVPSHWQISQTAWDNLRRAGIDKLGKLVDENVLDDFARTVRVSLLTFSKGLTLPDIGDRLVYALSALEGLLLRDSSEPIQQNLGERMAFMLEQEPSKRQAVARNLKVIYALRSGYIHHRVSVGEEKELEIFWANAAKTLLTAVDNVGRFDACSKFIDAIERVKFGGVP